MTALMIDVAGTELSPEDRDLLDHPKVGGVILFTRNYDSPKQVKELVQQLRKSARNPLLIGVDHEGGRVQRFRTGFSKIPAMANIWQYAEQQTDNDHQQMATAQQLAKQAGYLMAVEVQSVGIDISFSPVLDVNGISQVIGDRAFHHQPEKVIALAGAFVDGMHNANMKSTGKHFPGHGSVLEDSHIAMPVDERSQQQIFDYDMAVFKALINAKKVDAIMPAHVIYPAIDNLPVGFSAKWLKEILRNTLGFEGVIFSDDLSMQGAKSVGSIVDRVEMADQAGCDMLLVCNNRKDAILAIDNAKLIDNKSRIKRLNAMMLKSSDSFDKLKNNKHWQEASSIIQQIWPNN